MSIVIPNPPDLPDTPGGSSAELEVQRRMTKAFIDRLPVALVLLPHTRQKLPAGGWRWSPGTPRANQTMTLIEHTGPPVMITTQDGVERKVEFELLGEWDSLMAVGDTFQHKGKDWQVAELWYENDYERRARVTGRG